MITLEICVDSVASAIAAERGGAHRIELCSALSEAGLTPSLGMLRRVRSRLQIPIHVMIRPRAGNFDYSNDDFAIMQEDITLARESGANGVVFGLLTSLNQIDERRTRALTELARPMQVTFHRAFDLAPDPLQALEAVIRSGADLLLTSGGGPTAAAGCARLRQLVEAAGDRIRVMAGGGVRAENAAHLLTNTGAVEFHSSLQRHREQPVLSRDVTALREILESAARRRSSVTP